MDQFNQVFLEHASPAFLTTQFFLFFVLQMMQTIQTLFDPQLMLKVPPQYF